MKSVKPAQICKQLLLPAILALAFLTLAARAGTVWDGGGVNNLTSTAVNWNGDVAPTGGGVLTFSNTSPIGTTLVWDFATGFNPQGIMFVSGALGYTFNDPATATIIQLVPVSSVGGITNNSANNQTFNKAIDVFFNGGKTFNTAAGDLTITKRVRFRSDSLTTGQNNQLILRGSQNGSITASPAINDNGAPAAGASYSLAKTDAGTWAINGAISPSTANISLLAYAGTLTLNPGAGNTDTLGNVQTLGGALNLNSGTLNVANTGGAGTGVGLFVNGGTLTVAGEAVSATGYVTVNNSGTLSVSSGSFTDTTLELLNAYGSAGTVTLSGTGLMNLNVLRASHSTGLGIVNLNGGTLQLLNFSATGSGGTINFNGTTVQAKGASTGFLPANNPTYVKAGGAIFDTGANDITIAAALVAGTPSGGLTKLGTGAITVTGANTYSGGTTLNDGGIGLGIASVGTPPTLTSGPLGTGTLTIGSSAGKLFASGGARTVGNAITFSSSPLVINGANDLILSGAIDLGASTRTVQVDNSGATTLSGVIGSPGGGLAKTGTGTLTLNGTAANTYGGLTTVSAGLLVGATTGSLPGSVTVGASGFLKLSNPSAMASSAALTLDTAPTSGTVNLNFAAGTPQTIQALFFGATQKNQGTWGAIGSGAANQHLAFTGTGLLLVTTGNHAPVAPPAKTQSTAKNTASTFANAKLLAGATDADPGDTLTVTAANTTTPGATVLLEADDVNYTPPTGWLGSDSYTYTIDDGHGGMATGTVNVNVTSDGGASLTVVSYSYDSGSGTFSVTFAGIPGFDYTVEYAAGSPAPPWTKLGNYTAGLHGLFDVTDGPGQFSSRYYRTVYPSY